MNETAATLGDLRFTPEKFAHLVYFAETGKVSSRAAKDILRKMFETGLDPEEILNNEGLAQVSDESALIATVDAMILENEGPVSDYKKGKENALQFLIGKAMGKLKGAGNPKTLAELFKKQLDK